jgi:hypothetical protein
MKHTDLQLEQSKYVNKLSNKKTKFGLNFKKNYCILDSEPEYKKPFRERRQKSHEITRNLC